MDIFTENYKKLSFMIPAYVAGDAEFEMYDYLETMNKQYNLLKSYLKNNMVEKDSAIQLTAGGIYKNPIIHKMAQDAANEGKEYFYIKYGPHLTPVLVENPDTAYFCQSNEIPEEILQIILEG